jgi:hypothetical protein
MTKTFFLIILLAITPLLVAGQKSNESTAYHFTRIEFYDNVTEELTDKRTGSIDIIINSGEHPYLRIVDDKMVLEYTIEGPPERKEGKGTSFTYYKAHPKSNADELIMIYVPDKENSMIIFSKIEMTIFYNPDED